MTCGACSGVLSPLGERDRVRGPLLKQSGGFDLTAHGCGERQRHFETGATAGMGHAADLSVMFLRDLPHEREADPVTPACSL